MGDEARLNILDLPDNPLDKRARILQFAMQQAIPRAVKFMREDYAQASLLQDCIRFASWDLLDAPRSDLVSLGKVWFFPWAEASRELDQVHNACMLTMYKAAHDHLRRALELVIIGIYFTLEETPVKEARAWMASVDGTPRFSRTMERLVAHSRFSVLEKGCHWSDGVKQLYWTLSDVTHVRGERCSFHAVQPSRVHLGDVWVPEFDSMALAGVLDRYVDVVRHQATALAAANPVLLVGLNMETKFGFDDPVSGFFAPRQVELLRTLVLDDTRAVFDEITATDPEVQSLVRWYESKPDITPEELAKQAEELRRQFGRNG